MKRIAVFTGKRGGFGALLQLMRMIDASPNMQLSVIASDMHASKKFGQTVDEMRDAIHVDHIVDLGEYGDTQLDRATALGLCVQRLAPVLEEIRPDVLLLLGDRGETLAATMCAIEMGVVVAHVQAGDISGGIDDIHRHAITKLAHLHFSQNERQRERVIKLGEHPERVWTSGAPYIDNILSTPVPSKEEVLASLGIPTDEPYAVVLQHPDTYRQELAYPHMQATLTAMRDSGLRSIIIYPCSDPGYGGVLKALDEFKDEPRFHIFKNVEAMAFLGLLNGADVFVGNSSAGIIEAPYLHLPFILVGDRQDGRDMATNVHKPEPTVNGILQAIDFVQTSGFQAQLKSDDRPFGDGNASKIIFEVLDTVAIDEALFRKRITF